MTLHRVLVLGWLLGCLALVGVTRADAMTSLPETANAAAAAEFATGPVLIAQAQPTQPQAPAAPAADPSADPIDNEEPIGNVATVVGSATVNRNNQDTPLKPKDEIFQNDILQTAANSSLGVTFNDATTFNLTANARITIDSFVYEDGGKRNAALFDVAKGTVAFVAAAVAKTGDMKISTPTATLGIRGTSGVVEVPEGASAAGRNNVAVKLYPDADGKVGRIEVNDRAGARLGFLTLGSSGFTIRPGAGAARFAAVPLTISPQQMQRDQGFVRQVHSTQNLGRRVVSEHRAFRRANPGVVNPNRPDRRGQPGPQRQNAPQRQNDLQNRPGPQQQPGVPNRQTPPQRAGQPQQPGVQTPSGVQGSPGSPNRSGVQPPALQRPPGAPTPPGVQAPAGVRAPPGSPNRSSLQPSPGLQRPPGVQGPSGLQPPPGVQAPPGSPNRSGLQPSPGLQRQPGMQPPPGIQGAPGLQRPGLQNRPSLPQRPTRQPTKRRPNEIIR